MHFGKIEIFLIIIFAVGMSSSKGEEIDFKAMELSQKRQDERMKTELVILMSLETMFPDVQVRALAKAAGKGRVRKVEKLVAEGIDVNARGTKGATPLFWSLRKTNIKGFEKLLELGADPNIIFADASVMHWAARLKDTGFLQKAIAHGGNPNLMAGKPRHTPIFDTIGVRLGLRDGYNRAAMLVLLDAGADINAVTGSEKFFGGISMGGNTPVMSAANIVRFDIVYELLNRGADYEHKNDYGRTLLDRVAEMSSRQFVAGSKQKKYLEKVIMWLSEHGVNIPE